MSSPEDYARGAESVVKRGFTALKFDPVRSDLCLQTPFDRAFEDPRNRASPQR
jgi:L-alanine-DL-glutamate epimerase-like enolase superfamily enzyme